MRLAMAKTLFRFRLLKHYYLAQSGALVVLDGPLDQPR
jgi:hypothetical protein